MCSDAQEPRVLVAEGGKEGTSWWEVFSDQELATERKRRGPEGPSWWWAQHMQRQRGRRSQLVLEEVTPYTQSMER